MESKESTKPINPVKKELVKKIFELHFTNSQTKGATA
jgi:hypothetical protein